MKKDKHLGKLEFLAEILGLGKNVQTVWCKLCYEIMTKLTTCRLILGASKRELNRNTYKRDLGIDLNPNLYIALNMQKYIIQMQFIFL